METTEKTLSGDARLLLEMTTAALEPKQVEGGEPFVVLPAGASICRLEETLSAPLRICQKESFVVCDAFLTYVERFRTNGLIVMESCEGNIIKAHLCYHLDANTPSWNQHLATLTFRYDAMFEKWQKLNGVWMSQMDFAEYLEMNALGITMPKAAQVIEVARKLQACRKVLFSSGVQTTNGDVQFTYNEQTQAGAGPRGTIEVPERIEFVCPVFWKSAPVVFEAKLFWRITPEDNKLKFMLRIREMADAIEKAKEGIRAVIEKKLKTNILLQP
jgi:uncharacterized protein YfdQ (DUF2303 family)